MLAVSALASPPRATDVTPGSGTPRLYAHRDDGSPTPFPLRSSRGRRSARGNAGGGRRARLSRPAGLGVDCPGRSRLRRDDVAAGRVANRARPNGALLDAPARDRGTVEGRHGQGAVPHAGRPSGRGRADALPRRPALALPLVSIRMPAHVHVLRHGADALQEEPHLVRDPRSGAPLPARRPDLSRRVHGHGRADAQPRPRSRRRRPSSRHRDHASPDDHLDRRLDARADAIRGRGRGADSPRALTPRAGRQRCARS